MKFNRLRLTNIGAFYGNHEFDLRSGPYPQNVILIGGKNGAGKTTILESIRLALYGPLAFGFRTETNSYFEIISSKLNSKAVSNKENLFQIILDFEIVENFERNTYTIRRGWSWSGQTLKEEVAILRNNRELFGQEKEIFISKIREDLPPQLLEFFLFDGEKITQVITNNTLSSYLKETAKVMFNLDLFEALETDLDNFIKQEKISKNLTEEEKNLMISKEKLESYLQQRETFFERIEKTRNAINDHRALLNSLNKDYKVHGGLLKEQREELLQEMNMIEQQRGAMMEKNKELISSILPFSLVRDLLSDVVSQMEKEARYEAFKLIDKNKFADTLFNLHEEGYLKLEKDSGIVVEKVLKSLIENSVNSDIEFIFHASAQQRVEVSNLLNETLEVNANEIVQNFKENERMISRVKELREIINTNDSVSELKALLEKINDVQNKLNDLLHAEEQLIIQLEEIEEKLMNEEKNYRTLNDKVIAARKSENVFVLTNRVMEVSKRFRTIQLKKKLQQVEIETTKMLQKLFRKELFVIRVFIHPETFQLKLYGTENIEIKKENLSAGEKQILLLATIWAMSKCSKRKIPYVFDTLLGRLDQTHKKRIIQSFLPECGEQVIILSTDSEVDMDHFELLEPIVSRTYTIEYNNKKSTVETTRDFFNYYEVERNEMIHEFSSENVKVNR